ncbi:MAG: selenocysteine-specific translation factor, partial [Comamonadaceae bacterium]
AHHRDQLVDGGAQAGDAVKVGDERFYLRATIDELVAVVRDVATATPGGRFTAGQFRDASGIGRALAVQILEAIDRLGVTQRVADARVLRASPLSSNAQRESRP